MGNYWVLNMKKSLIIGIIVLFLGVAVQPGIIADVSIKSDNSDLEEITIQFYESDRSSNHTILLTKEQVDELENRVVKLEKKMLLTRSKIEYILPISLFSKNYRYINPFSSTEAFSCRL